MFKLSILSPYYDDFHVEIFGWHGIGFQLDVSSLPIANEVQTTNLFIYIHFNSST
jgi:hypothetical protein